MANTALLPKEHVIDALKEAFVIINEDSDKQREIDELLKVKHNFPRGTFISLLIDPNKLNYINEEEQGVVLSAVFDLIKDERMNVRNYYSTREINKMKKYKKEEEQKAGFPIVYEKVLYGSETDYIVKLPYQTIVNSMMDGLWEYNYQSQRNPIKKVKKDGTVSYSPKLNKKNVEEIKQLILEGKYLPDSPIVINVLYDGNDELFYNHDDMSLTIESASEIDIVDGFHRIKSLTLALQENPELEGYLYVSIRNYDLEMARYFLGQHNSFSTFDKTHVRELKSLQMADKITEDLNTKSDLRGRITTSTAVKKKFNEITNFAVLSDAIRDTFNPKTGKDRLEISYTLIRFFDYLLGSFPEEFVTNVEEVSQKSWINHHNLFVAHIEIAHQLYQKYGKDFPLDEIVRIVNSINFSKDQETELNDILVSQGKVNSKQVKEKIRKFANKEVSALLN